MSERDPASLTAPPAVDQALSIWKQASKGGARRRRNGLLHPRHEAKAVADGDGDWTAHGARFRVIRVISVTTDTTSHREIRAANDA
jgi:hypothetical protein